MKRIATMLMAVMALMTTFTGAGGTTAYVINTSGETLDRIDVATGAVTRNVLTLGTDINSYPNQIVVRDTLAYVVLSGTDEIQVIDVRADTTVGWIPLPDGSNPYWMGFLDDRYFYVSLLVGNSLAKIDALTRQVVKTTPVGQAPEGVLAFDDKIFAAITAYDFQTWTWGQGKVAVYDPQTDTVVAEIAVGKNPQFLDFDRLGRIHVVCTGNYGNIVGAVYIIDPVTYGVIDSIPIGGQPGQLSIGPGDIAYLAAGGWAADGEVFSYEASTGEVLHGSANPLYVDSGATAVATFQDSTVFVATFGDRINRLNSAGQKIATYQMGDGPIHLDFNYLPGDVNGDGEVSLADAVYLISYIFRGGASPVDPLWRSNPNGDSSINIADAVYLVSFIFRSGPHPQVGPTWIR